ncbi:hypothetical protein [Flavobacterium sp. U410]
MKKITLLLLTLNYCVLAFCQEAKYLTELDSSIGIENLPFHSGIFHLDVLKPSSDSPTDIYFLSEIKLGAFIYNNQLYSDLNLKYDVYNDQLVYYHSNTATNGGIVLERTKIKEFFLEDYHFIKNDSLGYMELKFNFKNNSKLLIKHFKGKLERVNSKGISWYFQNKSYFYFENNEGLFLIKNKKSVTKLFPKKKEEISHFYKNNDLLLKNDKTDFYKKLFQSLYEN